MEADYSRISRKITTTLFTARSFTSAAFVVSGTIGAIVSAKLGGNPAWAGIPAAVMQIGAAIASPAIGALTDSSGRRKGFTVGLLAGVIGAGLAASAVVADRFWIYMAGMLFMGVALTSTQLSRFAAGEITPPERARTQGANDMLIGFATAGASVSSGLLYASIGYALMGILGVIISLALLGLTIWWMMHVRRQVIVSGESP